MEPRESGFSNEMGTTGLSLARRRFGVVGRYRWSLATQFRRSSIGDGECALTFPLTASTGHNSNCWCRRAQPANPLTWTSRHCFLASRSLVRMLQAVRWRVIGQVKRWGGSEGSGWHGGYDVSDHQCFEGHCSTADAETRLKCRLLLEAS